jgi:hypothetical protein
MRMLLVHGPMDGLMDCCLFHKREIRNNTKRRQKWIIFTHHSPLIRKVTNLFKQTNRNIPFKSTNKIHQQLSHKSDNTNLSEIYELKCNTCALAYIGQSGRHITTRHKEHTRYIITNNPNSAYAMHISNNKH